jgi:Protein of unknown function (DUF5674)
MKKATTLSLPELHEMAQNMYGDLVKAVVDVEQGLFSVDAEMHVDLEQLMFESDSMKSNLWGINLYPAHYGTDKFVVFDSMINIRPRQNNRSRSVEDVNIQKQILEIVNKVVHE